jgi:hypothetical protein
VILKRGRFRDLVRRQLDLFAEEQTQLLAEARAADARWTHAPAHESEELFGEYQLLVEAIGELLYESREAYASTLDEATGDEYRAAFDREARRTHPQYVGLLGEDR